MPKQKRGLAECRRAALKELSISAHYIAGAWAYSDEAVAVELRRLADLMDTLATRGTAVGLTLFFGDTSQPN